MKAHPIALIGLLALLGTSAPVLAQPAAKPKLSLDQRLRKVEDELAIRRILIDYAAFLDGRDYDKYAALFTPDAEWANPTGSHKGQAAIKQMLSGTLGPALAPNVANYHIITNPRIDISGDTAKATSRYLFVMRDAKGTPTPSLAGIYTDDLVRLNGQWKIKRRYADNVMPTPEEWRKIISGNRPGQ
jgi:ketosteroid isomerase-like protein